MFSADDNNTETVNSSDLPGLDDLQLDMDYDQIMHYFENLKVSKGFKLNEACSIFPVKNSQSRIAFLFA